LPAAGRLGGLTEAQSLRRVARRLLLGAGLSEAQTLSLLPPALPDRLGLPDDHPWRKTLRLANPLSEEESVLRPTLIEGLLLTAVKNVARRNVTVALFEIGTTFAASGRELPDEPLRAAWILMGRAPTGWHGPHRDLDFFDAKGILERLADGLGVPGVRLEAVEREPMHPGRCARVLLEDREIGLVAEIHPRAARALDLEKRVAVAELDLEPLLASARTASEGEIPRFPAVERDLALLVPAGTSAEEVQSAVRQAAGPLLEEISIFDVYRAGELEEQGLVSLAFSLRFRASDRTLTDGEVGERMAAIERAAGAAGWTVR
jgi:phenylalanyl-tRNA synthetase beta chain